ncbi:MAG TPA: Hpt domain-containing protein [Acidisarcina sp.]|nr:Hpt domain-containing protein [Acidisarcina sp.]
MQHSKLKTKESNSTDTATALSGDRLQQLLLQLWMTSKSTVAERLEAICRAQALLEKNMLDEQARLEALDAAHKLAGILGTFGLPMGTELARQIEMAMEQAGKPGSVDAHALAGTLAQLSELINQKSAEIPSA